MYRVLLEARAERDLDALDRPIRERVVEALTKLKDSPRGNAKKITGTKNVWRIRVGDWRVIYEIDDARKEVKVYRVKHRSKAY